MISSRIIEGLNIDTLCLASEGLVQTDFRWKTLSIVYRLVSEKWNCSGKLHEIKRTTTTDLFMNHVIPSSILISMLRYDLFGMGEKPLIVHIHSITDTWLVYWIVMNCVINFGFSDLPFGPIWKKRLGISRPASVAFFRAMATALWDRRLSGFKLLGVDLCKPYEYNDNNQHMCVLQGKNTNRRLCQPMAMERKAQHVDGRDVVLDLIPFWKALYQQEECPETSYCCFCPQGYPAYQRSLSSTTGTVVTGACWNWF